MDEILQVMAAIQASDTWESLYTSLFHVGFVPEVCADRRRFVDLIKTIWSRNNAFQENPCEPLPGRIVINDGIEYYIHGVVHDSLSVSIKDSFKERVASSLQGYEVLCEDGFLQWLPAMP